MTIIPQCFDCKHFDRDKKGMVCAAFPAGIPNPILLADHDHREPFEGDGGIRFEPRDIADGHKPLRPASDRLAVGDYLGAKLDP